MMPKDLSVAEISVIGVYKIVVGNVVYYKFMRMRRPRYGRVSYYDRHVGEAQAKKIKSRLLALGGKRIDNGYEVVYARRIGSRRWRAL